MFIFIALLKMLCTKISDQNNKQSVLGVPLIAYQCPIGPDPIKIF